jgi:hypothetical protein
MSTVQTQHNPWQQQHQQQTSGGGVKKTQSKGAVACCLERDDAHHQNLHKTVSVSFLSAKTGGTTGGQRICLQLCKY